MSSVKKYEMAPEELYIQAALREGRARLVEEFSMKALGKPDVRFQARVQHLCMDHVHRLDLIFRQEGKLAPVIIFQAVLGAITKLILADGFHRHKVYLTAGRTAIRAYVIDVPMDRIEHETRVFAAMCNQVTSLGRTPQDMRKAVEMLFADPECWEWTPKQISEHCGVGEPTVVKYQREYAITHGRNLPRRPKSATMKKKLKSPGKPATLPTLPAGAEDEPIADEPPPLVSTRSFREWLLDQGILTESQRRQGGNLWLGSGFKANERAIILCPDNHPDGIYAAAGKALAFAKHIAPGTMPTVILEKNRSHNLIYSVMEQCGVAFLTPEELVAEVHASRDESSTEDEGSGNDGE